MSDNQDSDTGCTVIRGNVPKMSLQVLAALYTSHVPCTSGGSVIQWYKCYQTSYVMSCILQYIYIIIIVRAGTNPEGSHSSVLAVQACIYT